MITFKGGPAHGATLSLRSAPILLRVVRGQRGRIDALDQPEDVPTALERVHVYRRVSPEPEVMFLCGRGPGMGAQIVADYAHVQTSESLRDSARDGAWWRGWVAEHEAEYRPGRLEAVHAEEES